MKEALRYLNNAKEMLRSAPIEDDTYTDVKPVKEAFGTAYLAALEAINEYLIKRKGFTKKELPKSVDEYRKALQKFVSVHSRSWTHPQNMSKKPQNLDTFLKHVQVMDTLF